MARQPIRRLPIPHGAGEVGFHLSQLELPAIREVGVAQLGPGWTQGSHAHGEHEIHYVRRGRSILTYHGRTWPVKSGDIYFFRLGEAHGCDRNDSTDPMQVLYLRIAFPPGAGPSALGAVAECPVLPADRRTTELRAALKELADELVALCTERLNQREIGGRPSVQGKLLHVLGAFVAPPPIATAEAGTPRQRELAEAVLRLLETSGGAPPALAFLARRLGVSPAHLGEALRGATGRTYPEIAAAARLARARELLADPNLPVREVARRVGLSDPRSLARLFRRLTGRTPGAFRAT
jgi:AraC-like DNA-binding protein/mannose-6-phosphate isomerase-like protein (cupin superfamily)